MWSIQLKNERIEKLVILQSYYKFKNSTEHITESDSDTESPDNCDDLIGFNYLTQF